MLHSDICILNGQGTEVVRKLGECIYDAGGYFIAYRYPIQKRLAVVTQLRM